MAEQHSPQPIYRAVLLAGALIVAALLVRELLTLLLAVLITVIVAIPLSAAASRLERRRVPRALGALLALLLGLAVLGGIVAVVVPAFVAQVEALVDAVPHIVDDLRRRVHELTGLRPGAIGDRVQGFLERVTDKPLGLIGSVAAIGLDVAGVIGSLVLILVTAYYMAVRPAALVEGSLRLFPPAARPRAFAAMKRLRGAWVGWMQGVLADMLISGALLYAGLSIIGLDFALVFAVVTALLVVVPYFGAIVGAIPPVLFALTDSPGKALLTLGVYVLVQLIEGNVIVPLVMARQVRLHPALIAVGVVVVGKLFGVVGLIVAVPILSAATILVDELWVRRMEGAATGDAATPDADAGANRAEGAGAPGSRRAEPVHR